MAVLGRLLVSSAERLDLPDLLSLDSYAAGDWKYFLKGLVGDSKPFILKGFDIIDPLNAIGTQSCSVRVAESVVFYPGSSAGGFFHGLQEGHAQAIPLVPELRKNAVNYVYLTFSTFNTSVDTRAFWDPDKDGGAGGEFTQDINTESVLKVEVNVSTGSFPANTIPVAKITVGPVVITAIEDARDLMFRLGSGGINPNPFNTYAWRSLPGSPYQRSEPPTQMQAGGVNPFQGADKNILTLKEWMDAVMSKLRELGGTTYWYDDTSSFGIVSNFFDAVATAFKSKGKWIHDTTTPGLLTWTEDINIKMTSDPRTYMVRQGSKTLLNEQVMYIPMFRNLPLNGTDEPVSWISGQPYINTIGGAVGLFSTLSKGDFVKKANDSFDKFLRVEEFYDAVNLGGSTTTAAGARSVRLSSNYLGTTGSGIGRFDKGVYAPADVVVSDRNNAAIANVGGNFHWLALRSDTINNISNIATTNISAAISEHDGSTAKVTATAHGLVDGDRVTIAGTANFNGTYQVEVETVDIFYITKSGGPFADESGTGHYATVTTSIRTTPYGLQEESANHGFNSDDTIIMDGTTNYNGSFKINVRTSTTYTIPTAAPAATETTGTATLARVIVRTEGAVQQIIQGQIVVIGGSTADNIRQYLGMNSLSQTAPIYAIPPSYNTLDGMQDYNSIAGENITARVSKLTAMMADKAQDKTIKILASAGITTVTNTQNGAAQELTFAPGGASVTIATPGSTGNTFVALPAIGTPVSLLVNQTAYTIIDRNNPSTATITVANNASVPVDENVFILAIRLSTQDIYLWDARIVPVGTAPFGPGLSSVKLVGGGTLSNVAIGGAPTIFSSPNWTPVSSGPISLINDSFKYARQVNSYGGISRTLTQVEVRALKVGAPSGNIRFKIYSDNAGLPDTVLATSNPIVIGSITGSYTSQFFVMPIPILLNNATIYHYGVEYDAGAVIDGSNYVSWDSETSSPPNSFDAYYNGAVWSEGSGNTLISMRWYYGGAPTSYALSFTSDMYIEKSGLAYADNTILLANSPITFPNDRDVAYVIPNLASAGPNLTPVVSTLTSVPANGLIIARREGTDIIVGTSSSRYIPGESKKLYAGMSDQNLTYIGISDEADSTTDYTNATGSAITNVHLVDGENLTLGEKRLDIALDASEQRSDQDRNLKLINGGTWEWNLGVNDLTFSSDAYIQIPSLTNQRNTIQFSTQSPISLTADNQVAYVSINRTAGGTTNLTVSVATISSVPNTNDIVIIARRVGNDVLVGNGTIRLTNGQSQLLDSGVSNQLLSAIAAIDNADNSGQLRLLANSASPKRVNVSAVNKIVPDGTEYGIQLKNLMMDFSGAQIDFSTGSIYKEDGITALGINFTPVTIAASQYRWYSVTLLPSTVTVNNKITGQLIIVPASADGASAALAPKAAFASSGIKLGQVVVQESAGSIADIAQSAVVQLGTGGGGSGTGDANAILETIKNHFVDATFDFVTPNIFASNEDDLVDVSSTGSYNIADNVFEIDSAETLVSKQMLDAEFLASTNALAQTELMTFWNSLAIDTSATYQVSRNGGSEWQTVTMSRVGSTELYRGIHTFAVEATQQTLYTQLISDTNRDLNITTQQEVSQPFVVASGTKLLLRELVVAATKIGSPTGNLYVSICSDNSGDPNSILAESNAVTMASLVTGNNTITIPDTYLAAGTYHIKFRTDVTYKGIYSVGVTSIALQTNSTGSTPYARKYNGSAWSVSSTDNLVYTVKGISLDLRVKITSSTSARKLDGYGILYDKSVGNISTGIVNREVFHFSGTSNINEFTLTKFVPNADLLKVYDIVTGQVYTYGVWSLQGQKVVFEVNQFNSPGNALTLVFDQTAGGAFDNSDLNGLLLANNHLGSTDAGIDKSVNGRGIFLRRPDGTLREITIDNSDNIVVYSV